MTNDFTNQASRCIRAYLTEHYSDTKGLAITKEMNGEADMVMYIHRTDDTWRIVSLDFCDKAVGIRGRIVADRWMGWSIMADHSQPLRFAPPENEVTRMFRTRDRIAAHQVVPWQHVHSYLVFQTIEERTVEDVEWYGKMQLAGVGAVRIINEKACLKLSQELIEVFNQLIY